MGNLDGQPKTLPEMKEDVKKWREKLRASNSIQKEIEFQTNFLLDLCKRTGYDVRCADCSELFLSWEDDKAIDILTYRDKSFQSVFTKSQSSKHEPWLTAFDDSLQNFIKG